MALEEKDRALHTQEFEPAAAHVEAEHEIDLLELLYRMLEKLKYIVLSAVLCAAIAGAYSFFLATPIYQATAKLYVVNSKDSALNLADLQIGSYLTTDYQEVFKTWEVHEMVIQELGLRYNYRELESMLSIKNPANTRILNITVTSKDPTEATNLANVYAKIAKKYISTAMETEEPNVMSTALQPTTPISPNKTRNIALGFALGMLLAMGIIALQFILDDKIKTADDILRYANMPTLAVIPVMEDAAEPAGGAKRKAEQRGGNKQKGSDRRL